MSDLQYDILYLITTISDLVFKLIISIGVAIYILRGSK